MPTDLVEICTRCRAEYEDKISELRKQIQAKDYFVELMGPHMAPLVAKEDVLIDSYCELLRAYRKAKGGG